MKILNATTDFTDKNEWYWPDGDFKLQLVFKHVADIDIYMRYVKHPGVCVCAGGATGVWPYRYSQLFEQVITFEPMQANRECLIKNIEGIDNIDLYGKALSDKASRGSMVFEKSEKDNYGAVYFKAGDGEVETMRIDDLQLSECDLLQLDIEGHELEALIGGVETIKKCKPVIVLEEKPLPQLNRNYQEPRRYLEGLGYKEVRTAHRDVVFAC